LFIFAILIFLFLQVITRKKSQLHSPRMLLREEGLVAWCQEPRLRSQHPKLGQKDHYVEFIRTQHPQGPTYVVGCHARLTLGCLQVTQPP
jgi:hypothetical protein